MAGRAALRAVTPPANLAPPALSGRDRRVKARAALVRTYAVLLGRDVLATDIAQQLTGQPGPDGALEPAAMADALAAAGLLAVV